MRPGFTITELCAALALAGLVLAISVPRFTGLRDRLAVRSASTELVAAFGVAREEALARGRRVAITLADAGAVVAVHDGPDTLHLRPLGALHGVTLDSSRDSSAYAPNGLGFGAANLRVIVARGAAADTVRVSRLGRATR